MLAPCFLQGDDIVRTSWKHGDYSWAYAVKDVDVAQADLAFVDLWSEDAAKQLKISIETDVLADVYADAATANKGATAGAKSGDINLGAATAPKVLTKDNILDFIVDVGTVLDEQNVPEDDRHIILPAWGCGMIKKSDLKDCSLSGDTTSIMRNGRIGMIDRFTLYASNLLTQGTDTGHTVFNAIACHKSALTFATQLVENETIDNQNDFGKLNRGLQVYGYETIKTEAMCHLYIAKS